MLLTFRDLIPARQLAMWLGVSLIISMMFSIASALIMGFEAAAVENGPEEFSGMAVLLATALIFLAAAVSGKAPGGPLLVLLSLVFGFMGLREYEAPFDNEVLLYLAGHASRLHWVLFTLAVAACIAVRDRRWTIRDHLEAVKPVWLPLIAAALIVVLSTTAETVAGDGPSRHPLHDQLVWLEEALELSGYALSLVTALWMARRWPLRAR